MRKTSRARLLLAGVCCLAASAVSASAASYQQLHVFAGGSNNDGALPQAGLIAVGGVLYGVTDYGNGASRCPDDGTGCGIIFSLAPKVGEQVLYSFQGNAAHGTSDGSVPFANLIALRGSLYGTTYYGGAAGCLNNQGCGTVFRFSPDGKETVVHAFSGTDGGNPGSALLALGGKLYGTTSEGGAYNGGTVYSIGADGTYTVLHSFAGGADGAEPVGNLIALGGTLYGATFAGGIPTGSCMSGCGTVYAITPAGAETVLYKFLGGMAGGSPNGGLLAQGSLLYGTTRVGGDYNDGTIFSLSLAGVPQSLQSFQGTNGAYPSGGLVALGGTLYGTTLIGGSNAPAGGGAGTVFSFVPGGAITTVYSFQGGSDGSQPSAGLVAVGATLYGTTEYGGNGNGCFGTAGCGTVFAVTP